MKTVLSSVVTCLGLLAVSSAVCAEPASANVTMEHTFNVSADTAWKALGRFCAISEWQSLVVSCVLEERKDGIHRTLVMRNDTTFVERLEEYSSADRSFAYTIRSGPLQVSDYRSEFRLVADGGQASRLSWKGWYKLPAGSDEQAVASGLKALFANGIKGIRPVGRSAVSLTDSRIHSFFNEPEPLHQFRSTTWKKAQSLLLLAISFRSSAHLRAS